MITTRFFGSFSRLGAATVGEAAADMNDTFFRGCLALNRPRRWGGVGQRAGDWRTCMVATAVVTSEERGEEEKAVVNEGCCAPMVVPTNMFE